MSGISPSAAGTEPRTFGYTYQRPDGNRLVEGKGTLPATPSLDIQLGGRPVWLVAAPDGDTIIWVVLLEKGETRAFRGTGSAINPIKMKPLRLPVGTPPVLAVGSGEFQLLASRFRVGSTGLHTVLLPKSGIRAFVKGNGNIILKNSMEDRFTLDALPDALLIFDDAERILILTGGTDAYRHGVLGDTVEAQSVTLIETGQKASTIRIITLPTGSVIEGIAPIWSDLNGDGNREIILTVSDDRNGSRFVVYDERGTLVASGSAVGSGYRWYHQIAVAPFGPAGETELAGVRTPHIGGVVEFFRLEGNTLRKTAGIEGYSSHVMGSRNLDMAAAGDFDGDGRIELLLPAQSLQVLAAVRRTKKGAQQVWSLPLHGRLSTNLAAVTLRDGSIAIGVGREDGTLRLWLPRGI